MTTPAEIDEQLYDWLEEAELDVLEALRLGIALAVKVPEYANIIRMCGPDSPRRTAEEVQAMADIGLVVEPCANPVLEEAVARVVDPNDLRTFAADLDAALLIGDLPLELRAI